MVAALGHVFGPSGERGVFRTEDGGRSWSRCSIRGADTGAVEIAGDPAHPERLYAALWQVRRHPWLDYFQPTDGPGSGIYTSIDGGRSWAPAGAPAGRRATRPDRARGGAGQRRSPGLGRAVSGEGALPSPTTAAPPGAASTSDGSLRTATWPISPPTRATPTTVWAMGRGLRRSTDGGKSFTIVKGAPGGDDYHFLWIDPTDSRRMITGADQGAVVTLNGGATWSSWYNQPTGQFYRLAADDRFPYWIYSGQQDSGTVAIASRSDYGQLTFRDWHPVGGDERDGDMPDPANPDIVYGAGLGGRLSKWNARTGQVQNVSPWPVSSYGARPGTGALPLRLDHAARDLAAPAARDLPGRAGALPLARRRRRRWTTISPDLTGAVAGGEGLRRATCRSSAPPPAATA